MPRAHFTLAVLLAIFVAGCEGVTLTTPSADGGSLDSSLDGSVASDGATMDGALPNDGAVPQDSSAGDSAVDVDAGPRPDSCAPGPNTYYFSDVSGDDARSNEEARNPATPWRTLAKASSVAATLSPGACLLFKRSETFFGSLSISASGSMSERIVVGAYGSGTAPTLSGFTEASGWTSLGGDVWESGNEVSEGANVNLVLIGGANTPMGRWPDSGYHTMQTASSTSLSDPAHLNASALDFTGAEAVVREVRWVIDRYRVTGATGSMLSFGAMGSYTPTANWGYFVQDHLGTLSANNEWYYDRETRHLFVYGATMPTDVRAASVAVGVDIAGGGFITLDGLRFEGFTTAAVDTNAGSVDANSGGYVTVQGCEFENLGHDGVYGYPNSAHLTVLDSNFSEVNSTAIHAGSSDDAVIRGNTLHNIGNIVGAGASGDGGYEGVVSNGERGEISFNVIRNVGYVAIKWDGDGTVVANNFIDTTNYIKDDGGGIYCYPSQGPTAHSMRRVVRDNIILNSIGAGAGSTSPTTSEAEGIYNDGTSSDVDYVHNTIAHAQLGIFLNGAHEVTVADNVVFDCKFGLYLLKYNDVQIDNISIQNNSFVARTSDQYAASYRPMATSMPATFSADNNVYARPVDSSVTTSTPIWRELPDADIQDTLAAWQGFSGEDSHSNGSPRYGLTADDIRVEYNATGSELTVPLSVPMLSMDGVAHSGSITLAPYSGEVLVTAP